MEATDGATSHGDTQHGKHGMTLGMMAGQSVRHLWHPTRMGHHTITHTDCHYQQRHAKDGIDASNQLVNGEQGGQDIIDKNNGTPYAYGSPSAPAAGHVGK